MVSLWTKRHDSQQSQAYIYGSPPGPARKLIFVFQRVLLVCRKEYLFSRDCFLFFEEYFFVSEDKKKILFHRHNDYGIIISSHKRPTRLCSIVLIHVSTTSVCVDPKLYIFFLRKTKNQFSRKRKRFSSKNVKDFLEKPKLNFSENEIYFLRKIYLREKHKIYSSADENVSS